MTPSTLAPPPPAFPAPAAAPAPGLRPARIGGAPVLSDEALAGRVATGDRQALATLVARHDRGLRRMCGALMRDDHAGGDAVQEAWLRAWTALGRAPEPPRRFLPWLRAIARNACLDAMRDGARCEPAEPADLGEGSAGPEEVLDVREEARQVLGDLGDLPDRQRAALVGSLEGLSADQVAARLGVSRAQAGTLLSEGRRSLAQRRAGRALDCADVEAAVGGRAGRNRSVRAHLESCPRCRSAHRRARARALLARVPLPPWLWPFGERLGGAAAAGPLDAAAGSMGAAVAAVAAAAALVAGAGAALPASDLSRAGAPEQAASPALNGPEPSMAPVLTLPAADGTADRGAGTHDARRGAARRAAAAPAPAGDAPHPARRRPVAPGPGARPGPVAAIPPSPAAGAPAVVSVSARAGELARVDAGASLRRGVARVHTASSLDVGVARVGAGARVGASSAAGLSVQLGAGSSR